METKEIISLYERIEKDKELGYNQNPDKFRDLIKDLSKEDLTILFYLLVSGNDFFKWFNFISETIKKVASPNMLFVNLLDVIITKTKNDMAQGLFIRSLIELGEAEPELSWNIFYLISGKRRNGLTLELSGLLLGGIGKVQSDKAMRYIKRVLNQEGFIPSMSLKIACIKASRVMLETKQQKRDDFYRWLIGRLEEQKHDEEISKEYISLLIDLSEGFTNKYCEDIMTLFKSLPFVSLRRIVSFMLSTLKGGDDLSKQIEFAEALKDYDDEPVAHNLMYFLTTAHKFNKQKAFGFVKVFIEKDYTGSNSPIYYLVDEMFKEDSSYYIKEFEDWINEVKNQITLMNLRRIISHVSNKSKDIESKVKEVEKMINQRIHSVRKG